MWQNVETNFYRDILFTLDDQNTKIWQVVSVRTVVFDHGPHGVFEKLEENVIQVGRNVNNAYAGL